MIIDLHTHAFPEKIAARTLEALIANTARISDYPMKNYTDGTASGLLEVERRAGVDLAVVLPIVTNPKQSETINRVAKETNDANCGLYSFGSLHPADPDALSWVDRLAEDGLKGIKLHPEFQNIYADSDEMTAVCRRAAQYGMTVVLHAGRDIGYLPPVKTEPDMLLRLIDRVPDLKLVAAHLGGWMMWEEVAEKLVGTSIYFDTAFIADFIDKAAASDIISAHGADKVLFGSDAPWEDPAKTLKFLRSLSIDPEDLKKICGQNAAGLLGI
ncbi:MAG: amidohydrolase family protein [Clostridia bacterium]|nr:amidohydrolase family protein [Clostridia bacterium]